MYNIVPNFPDMLKCSDGSSSEWFYSLMANYDGGQTIKYTMNYAKHDYYVQFNIDGSYHNADGVYSTTCRKSIFTIYIVTKKERT